VRLYIGQTMQMLALGTVLGALLGYWLRGRFHR
jgi:hypothetical protein